MTDFVFVMILLYPVGVLGTVYWAWERPPQNRKRVVAAALVWPVVCLAVNIYLLNILAEKLFDWLGKERPQ